MAHVLNLLAWLLATSPEGVSRDPARALSLAKEAIELSPGYINWNTLGAAQYRLGQWKEAVASLQKSVALPRGKDGYDLFFLAMAHWKLGNKGEARKHFAQAVDWMDKTKPRDEQFHRYRAEAEELLEIEKQELGAGKQAPE